MKKLAIIIPVYNEEKNIEKLIKDWAKEISKHYKNEFKMIVINDGSTDKTHEILKNISKKLIIYINQKNMGHGNTCVKGYNYALKKNFDIIFQIDSDDQCDPKYFKLFLDKISSKDAVYGQRVTREDGLLRLVFSKVLSILIFLRTLVYIKDSNVPYRMIKSKVLRAVINQIPENVILKPLSK